MVEWGDHLRTCVSTRMLHLCPLVVVVIEGVANTQFCFDVNRGFFVCTICTISTYVGTQ
jgi:hypothetical protein